MRLLKQGAAVQDILSYLEEMSSYMGLAFDRRRALHHGVEFVRWYQHKWQDTKV